MPETLYIRDAPALAQLADRIADEPELAIDTEFLRERTYYPRLCLLQLATPDVLALVDPLAVPDLDPLWDRICGGCTIVLHAGTQDLEIIQRLAGRLPARIFDTQIAAAFLGLGHSVGYSRLIETVLEASPKRSEAYTDWSRRPLTQEQQEYALDDVRYLLECVREMRGRLAALGRTEWVREETEAYLRSICHTPEARDQWRRVKGARRLSGRALAVLQEVAAWREDEAVSRDVPRQRVVPDRVLVELGRRGLTDVGRIEGVRGLHPREAQRSAQALSEVIGQALDRPRSEWPCWPELPRLPDDPISDAVASLLDAVLRARADALELAPQLLATRSDLTLLVRLSLQTGGVRDQDAARIALLQGWRRELVGEDLLAVLTGARSVRVERDAGLEIHLD